MDLTSSVNDYIKAWQTGGIDQCRSTLIACHVDISALEQASRSTTIYNALVASTLTTLPSAGALTVPELVTFIVSVLQALPSSSAHSELSVSSPDIIKFSELFIDVIWTIDAQLYAILEDSMQPEPKGETASENDTSKVEATVKEDQVLLAKIVKGLVTNRALDANLCRQRLELSMLADAGLIINTQKFHKKEVQIRTRLFYKQQKFNLLREQSEGWSKLVAELTASLGPPHEADTGLPSESPEDVASRAQSTWTRLVSIIGFFDLDPNRALDVILDVFSVHICTHWSFFIALFEHSPWANTAELTAKDDVDMQTDTQPPSFLGKTFDEAVDIMHSRAFGDRRRPAVTGKVHLAQILGFKFTYYELPEVKEKTPKNLYLVAALLIREGFITLEQLYLHLSPEDADMDALHKSYLASVDERVEAAKVSQLAMAAPLESSGTPQPKTRPAEVIKSKAQEHKEKIAANQKLGILRSLMSFGAFKPAFSMLARFPWVVDADTQVADMLLHMLAASTHTIGQQYRRYPHYAEETLDVPVPAWTQRKSRYGANGMVQPPPPKPQLTTIFPVPLKTHTTHYVYFYPGWSQALPICTQLDDCKAVIGGFLSLMKFQIYRNVLVFHRVLQLMTSHLLATSGQDCDATTAVKAFWYDALRSHILPAISMLRGNVGVVVDMFAITRYYDITERWSLYAEWKTKTMQSHPELRLRFIQVDRESKGVMRRLSKQTVHTLDSAVLKLAIHNPCIFFPNAINQIMAYDNLAIVVLEAFSRLTNFAFDVLQYLIFDALSNPHKERVKDDGVNTSDWLQSLATFIGILYERYGMDLAPLLNYIAHQLHNRQATDIIILKELITHMCGIEPLPSLQNTQIEAMAGGPTLGVEAIASAQRGCRRNVGRRLYWSTNRLRDKLAETNLAFPLLVQVAQQRQSCVFQITDAPLKSLSNLFDTLHGVFLQYLDLLNSHHDFDNTAQEREAKAKDKPPFNLEQILPPLRDMCTSYGLSRSIAMHIFRPLFTRSVTAAAEAAQRQREEEAKETERRLKAALTAKKESTSAISTSTSTEEPMPMDVSDVKPAMAPQSDSKELGNVPDQQSPWIAELAAYFDDVRLIAPDACDLLGPAFYLTFWQMSSYDLSCPDVRYAEESSKLAAMIKEESAKIATLERTNGSTSSLIEARTKHWRYSRVHNALSQEHKQQKEYCAYTEERLAKEKMHWFPRSVKSVPVACAIIEQCLLPRCVLSPMDADYCARVIKVLHRQGTPGFNTLMLYDKLFGEHIGRLVFSSSENEARNFGRFIYGILNDAWQWHQDENLYNSDNRMKGAGGKTVMLPGFMRNFANKDEVDPAELTTWHDIRKVVKKWHRSLTKSLCACIDSGEFMHIYNAIIVLREISSVFPMAAVFEYSGLYLSTSVENLLKKEKRGDLKVLGRAYQASLQKREKEWRHPTSIATSAKTTTASHESSSTSTTRPELDRRDTNTAPSAPRASNGPAQVDRPSSLPKSIPPRPDVIKRVRPVNGTSTPVANGSADAMDIDSRAAPGTGSRSDSPVGVDAGYAPAPSPSAIAAPRPITASNSLVKETLQKQALSMEQANGQGSSQEMLPPSDPTQSASAQELREIAKVSMSQQSKASASSPSVSSSRRRSVSPSSKPGTRNASVESRNSGPELDRDDRRSRRHNESGSRRDRRGERERPRDKDRDNGKGRDDRDQRESRPKDRERDKDRESRPKDRERSDRHRRDHEDKDRSGRDRNKERDGSGRSYTGTSSGRPDDREASRAESRRRSPPPGDTTPKRRRPDEDGDRDPKRTARSDRIDTRAADPRDDRDRKASDRERRRDRREDDGPGPSIDKALDRRSGTENGSSLPAAVPSGPRAMGASDNRNPSKSSGPLRGYPARDVAPTREQARDSHRDVNGPQDVSRRDPGDRDNGPPRGLHPRDSSSRDQSGRGHRSGNPEDSGNGSGSLLSRVSEHPFERRGGDSPVYDNDHNRKRALEENPHDSTAKRPRINRTRYVDNALAGAGQDSGTRR